jgi:hypothetical protein
LQGTLDPDATVEVVGHGGDQQHDDEGGEGPVEDEAQEGHGEDVEADVGAELGVGGAEIDPVAEQHPLVPLVGEAPAGDQGQEGGHRHPHPTGVRPDQLPVALDQLLLRARGSEAGGHPVGDDEVAQDEQEEGGGEDHRRQRLGHQQATPHLRVPDLLEPQVVGVEAGDAPEADKEDEQSRGQPHQPGASGSQSPAPPFDRRYLHAPGL